MNYVIAEYRIKEYVEKLFNTITHPCLWYHNLAHTEKVVLHCREIAARYPLDEKDYFILMAAAWFHDTGHLFTGYAIHEEEGIHVMKSFLNAENMFTELASEIAACIMATKYPPHPETLLEKIICDADTYHFGTLEFRTTDGLVKKEAEICTGKSFNAWYEKTLQMLTKHTFFTSYCQGLLEKGKQENISYLQSLIAQDIKG